MLIDCFSASACDWDVGRRNVEDPMHQVANNAQAILCMALDVGRYKFTTKRRRAEVELGRFPELEIFEEKMEDGSIVNMFIYAALCVKVYCLMMCAVSFVILGR